MLGRGDRDAEAATAGGGRGEGLRAMAAVLLRTLFDARSDVWFRAQHRTHVGGNERQRGGGLMHLCVGGPMYESMFLPEHGVL